ncbi:DUF732 domain-containing protein [Nocardia sp. NPDC052001]|uniref:DUF732 domain-containing protein n=1 Tax=Nocardia sp. NPDC052001 TaxID=3154853 RepID=UPI00343AE4D6
MSARPWAALPIAISVVILAACGSDTESPSTKDVAFLAAVKHEHVPTEDGDIFATAKTVCREMREQGRTAADEVTAVAAIPAPPNTASPLYTGDEARKIVNQAITFYCPEFNSQTTN